MASEKIYNLENRKTYIINAERRGENSMACPVCSGDRKKKNVKCMSFNTIEGVGHCNHCNARFVRKSEDQEVQRYTRPVPTSNPTALPDKMVNWFKERGINSSTLIDFNVEAGRMFFPQVAQERNCIMFNYYRDGELINIKYRDAEKNFRLVKDAELIFYNMDSIQSEYVVITEGECFHPSAEVLTQYGWVRFEEFEALENPMVAQYNNSGDIEFVKPIAFISKNFEGNLIEMKNQQRFYSLTTPEHNMVYVDPNGNIIKKKHYEASARYSIPRTAKHDGSGINLSDDEIRLCIAVSADFTIREKGDIYGSFKKQRKVERITGILNRLGIEYSTGPTKGDYTSFFIRRGNAPKYLFKKFPSNWIFESTQRQKDLIISEILHWDGNLVPERNQIEYSSKDCDNATFVQTISHLCGYCSTIMSRSNEFGSWYKVSILFGKQTTSNQSLKRGTLEVEYKGVVNCVQVPSGMILVRQNGCISISGNCDAMAYHQVGITSVVSVPNGASKNNRLQYVDNCIDRFEDVKIIYLATDDDEPGRILQEELARRFGKDRCRKISFFGKKDANELLIADPLMLPETLEAAEEYPLEGIVTIDGIADDIWRLRREGLKPGCDISIDAFNELLTFVPGYVTGVTGIPNHGKSEFLDQIMVDLSVRHGWRFGIFSPENYPLQLHFSKVASKLVGTAFNDMGDREIIAAMNYCRDNFFYIAPEEDNSLDSIIEHAKSLVKKYGINAIIIDAWNKLEHSYQTSETQHISKELDKLISFCRKYSVHAFVVAHPTKMSRDPKTQQYNVATLYDMAGCHDEETEVLTNDGWKRHAELDGSEDIACFDLESETLKYLRPSDYHVYPYKGEMHHFKGKSMDIMVSPNHRMVIGKTWKNKSNRKPSKYNNQKWNFIYASDISKSPVVMPKSAELVSNTFVKHMKFDNGEIYDNEKLAYFLGWYLSEGSISMNSISICQALQNSTNLKKSFADLNLHVKESQFQGKKGEKEMYRFRVYAKSHPELIKWIINSFGNGASDKRIPVEFFNTLGKRGKELLIESLIEGDGSKTKNGFKYHTASKQLADDVCRLAVELGYKTIVGHYPSTNPKWLDKYVVYLTKDKPTEWIMPANQNKVEYDGNIYCLTVPTGAYVTRRNGKVAITGNSAHFYNKCDNGISVYRHFFEDGGSMPEIFVQKVKFKHWGRQGSREMQYDIPSGRYYIVGKLNKTSYLSTEFNQQEFEL